MARHFRCGSRENNGFRQSEASDRDINSPVPQRTAQPPATLPPAGPNLFFFNTLRAVPASQVSPGGTSQKTFQRLHEFLSKLYTVIEFRPQRTKGLLTEPQGAAQMESGTEVESERGLVRNLEFEFAPLLHHELNVIFT